MTRRLSNDDLFSLRWVRDPQVSPDGDRVAYVESWLDGAADAELSAVRVVTRDGAELLRLHEPGARVASPRWSPDGGRLAFLADRDLGQQVWLVEVAHHDDWTRLTELSGVPVDLDWSPDGRMLAVAVEELHELVAEPGYALPGLPYHVDGSAGPARRSWYLCVIDSRSRSTERLDLGDRRVWHPRWSPVGTTLAFLQASDALKQTADICTVGIGGGTAPGQVTDTSGPIRAFAWAPGGDRIAFVGHRRGEATDLNYAVWSVSVADRTVVELTDDLDLSAGVAVRSDDARALTTVLAWSRVTDRIYFEVSDGGRGPILWIDHDRRSGKLFDAECVALAPSVAARRPVLAAVLTTPDSPGDVVVLDELAGEGRAVSASNAWLADVELPRTELVRAVATDGVALEGWLVTQHSETEDLGGRPLVVSVHGGPHYAVGWRFYFEHLRLAARGYAVLSANPRGSLGYGEAFATGIRGSWGQQDWLDLSAVITQANTSPLVDPRRNAITGVSYGGFMALWAISRTAQFRAAICENGISNFLALWGTSQGAAVEVELGGPPWRDGEHYLEQSPIVHAGAIDTPLLLLHAEADRTCPVEQSEQMFAALKRLGREVEFVRLTGEGHLVNLVGRPSRRVFRAAVVDAWLSRHLAAPARGDERVASEGGHRRGAQRSDDTSDPAVQRER